VPGMAYDVYPRSGAQGVNTASGAPAERRKTRQGFRLPANYVLVARRESHAGGPR